MPLENNILWTIGGPEAPAGTLTARTAVLPVTGHPGFTQRATRMTDPVIAGGRMDVKEYPVRLDVNGPFPLSPRVGPGFGKPLKSLFGLESAPAQIGAIIRLRCTAVTASCKIVADTATNTLKSYIGVAGAEIADAAFGVAGSIDLTAVANDTVAEIVALIDAYATYDCQLVTGDGAVVSGDIVTMTTQAFGRWCYLFFTRATGGAYWRTYTADLTATEHPVYSVEGEGYQDNLSYTGVQFTNLKLSAALGGMVSATMEALGFVEGAAAGASGLTLANLDPGDPLIFSLGASAFGSKDYPKISSLDLSFDDSHNKDGYGQGSLSRIYHGKGKLVAMGSLTVLTDTDSYARRADLFVATMASSGFQFAGKVIGGLVKEMLIIELPYSMVTDPYDFVPDKGLFKSKINFKCFNPGGTKWDVPVKVHMIGSEVAAF